MVENLRFGKEGAKRVEKQSNKRSSSTREELGF